MRGIAIYFDPEWAWPPRLRLQDYLHRVGSAESGLFGNYYDLRPTG